MIVLIGFTKKSEKIPAKELKRAQANFEEFQEMEGGRSE